MALVLDTGTIVALLDASDPEHRRCVRAVEDAGEDLVIPAPVLVEVDYWLHKLYGARTRSISAARPSCLGQRDVGRAAARHLRVGEVRHGDGLGREHAPCIAVLRLSPAAR